jgi:hypothetical protein
MSGVKSFVVFMFAMSRLRWPGAGGNQNTSCRCLASEACWPTAEKWDAFNITIGGRLIAPEPTGKYCSQQRILCVLATLQVHSIKLYNLTT